MFVKMQNNKFDSIYKIMEKSFPLDEFRPYEEQKALLNNPYYTIYIWEDEKSKRGMGFLAVYQFEDFMFVEHFAVDPACRNSGLGSRMLKELFKIAKGRVVLEVELPESDITKRRIGFYERNGFSLNSYKYVQPPISKGRNSINLALMTTDGKIDENTFNYYRDTIHKVAYKVEVGKWL